MPNKDDEAEYDVNRDEVDDCEDDDFGSEDDDGNYDPDFAALAEVHSEVLIRDSYPHG